MVKKENNNNSFTSKLYSWTTGKVAKLGIGLAIGYTIYKTKIVHKLIAKAKSLFGKKKDQETKTDEQI